MRAEAIISEATARARKPQERPILFSGPMVRALLDGRKTMTRRIAKFSAYPGESLGADGLEAGHCCTGVPTSGWVLRSRGAGGCWNDRTLPLFCPYGEPGDRIVCRESWTTDARFDAIAPNDAPRTARIHYLADGPKPEWAGKTRVSIHMPRWMCRVTLEITDVRVERLTEISEEEARAEGVTLSVQTGPTTLVGRPYATAFRLLWSDINGAESWDANPWVWVLNFRRLP